jgi:hypothetical protein
MEIGNNFNYDERDFIQDGRRKRLSQDESELLLEAFSRNPRPSQDERNELANKLGMNSRSIQIWFQNRRAKLKKESNDPELFSIKALKTPEIDECVNLPAISAGNFKELCLPKYLDIPIKGQQLTSEDMSKNDAIRKFWKKQQEITKDPEFSTISSSAKIGKLQKSTTPTWENKKKIKLSQDNLKFDEIPPISFNMPDLVPFNEISSTSGSGVSSTKSNKLNCNNLKFLTQSVKQINNQSISFKPKLDSVTTDLSFLFDGNKNLSSLELLGTTKRLPHAFDQTFSEIFQILPEINDN